jgi:hypothetical protein
MSSINTNSRINNAYIARVPCCKVCKDAGEPENVYSSHYVKDREGNVACPKLKAIVCLNCGKRGHTSGYCKTPVEKPATKAEAKKLVEPLVATTSANSRFACLFDDDSDDEKVAVARKPTTKPVISSAKRSPEKANENYLVNVSNVFDFPSLSADVKPTNAIEKKPFSYANMAAKPIESKAVRQVIAVPKHVRPASPTIEPPRQYQKASEIDWAMEDSDSDDE